MDDFMAWSLYRHYTGNGIFKAYGGTGYTYIWNGHSFNPPFQDQLGISQATYVNQVDYDISNCYWAVPSSVTSFNLTGFQTGNEAICSIGVFHCDNTGDVSKSAVARYKKSDGTVLLTWTYTLPSDSVGNWAWVWFFWGFGVRTQSAEEIDYNGTFYSELLLDGSSVSNITLTTSNLDTANVTTSYYSNRGHLWVDSDKLYFINGNGRKMYAYNDGSSYGSGADPGAIWISSTGGDYHIYYADSAGFVRRTKNGSNYSELTDASLGSTSTANAGYIWVDSGDDHYIYAVAQDGKIIRIGAGYRGASDMQ